MDDASDEPEGFCWTGWPVRPVISLYWPDGQLARRSRAASFDLTDNWAYSTAYHPFVRLGISSRAATRLRWTEKELKRQEENICYDLSMDGLEVQLNRLKGIRLLQAEEALWELHISSI